MFGFPKKSSPAPSVAPSPGTPSGSPSAPHSEPHSEVAAASNTALRPPTAPGQKYTYALSDAQWREKLSALEYNVLRLSGTERAFSGEYEDLETEGTYHCRGCDAVLYTSGKKFNAGCGWPAFWGEEGIDSVEYIEDRTLGMVRTEIRCATCGGHLGHVFKGEGFGFPTDARHCVNSASITFKPAP